MMKLYFPKRMYVIRVNCATKSEIGCTGCTASCDRRVIISVKASEVRKIYFTKPWTLA